MSSAAAWQALPVTICSVPGSISRSRRADITYVELAGGGFCDTAFVTDAYSRAIVGWKVAATLHTGLALDAWRWRCGSAKTASVRHSSTTVTGVLDSAEKERAW